VAGLRFTAGDEYTRGTQLCLHSSHIRSGTELRFDLRGVNADYLFLHLSTVKRTLQDSRRLHGNTQQLIYFGNHSPAGTATGTSK
jgi:hypothetical protein